MGVVFLQRLKTKQNFYKTTTGRTNTFVGFPQVRPHGAVWAQPPLTTAEISSGPLGKRMRVGGIRALRKADGVPARPNNNYPISSANLPSSPAPSPTQPPDERRARFKFRATSDVHNLRPSIRTYIYIYIRRTKHAKEKHIKFIHGKCLRRAGTPLRGVRIYIYIIIITPFGQHRDPSPPVDNSAGPRDLYADVLL